MANGRMINKTICGDKRVNDLSGPWSMLAFTWLISHADCEGRTHGDPAMVKSMVFPRRADITVEDVEGFILEWTKAGLIIWYEADDDLWIWFVNFDKNQPGLRKDKEAPSHIQEPSLEGTDKVRSKYGLGPYLGPVKLKEIKLIKGEKQGENPDPDSQTDLELYAEVTGLTPDYMHCEEVERNVHTIREKHKAQPDEAKRVMVAKFALWCEQKTEAGKPYNRSNPKWLEWCITDFSPSPPKNGHGNRPPIQGV